MGAQGGLKIRAMTFSFHSLSKGNALQSLLCSVKVERTMTFETELRESPHSFGVVGVMYISSSLPVIVTNPSGEIYVGV